MTDGFLGEQVSAATESIFIYLLIINILSSIGKNIRVCLNPCI